MEERGANEGDASYHKIEQLETDMKKIAILGLAIAAGLSLNSVANAQGTPPAKPAFSEVDANGDGSVTREEMAAFRENRSTARFTSADTDGDGLLSATELSAMAEARTENRTARMIERLDSDADGMLSMDEMEAGMDKRGGRDGAKRSGRHGGERDGSRGGERHERGDRGDSDGRGARFFGRADVDDNGSLSAEEWDAMGPRKERDEN